jgi:hypothetical protein
MEIDAKQFIKVAQQTIEEASVLASKAKLLTTLEKDCFEIGLITGMNFFLRKLLEEMK